MQFLNTIYANKVAVLCSVELLYCVCCVVLLLELFCDRGPQIISTRAACVASPALWHLRKTRTLSGKSENTPRKFGRNSWIRFWARIKHKTSKILCTHHWNGAAYQLHNHMLSAAIPYDCCCIVPTLRFTPSFIIFPNVPFFLRSFRNSLLRPPLLMGHTHDTKKCTGFAEVHHTFLSWH